MEEKTIYKTFFQFDEYIREYYDNDEMAHIFADYLYREHGNVVNLTCKFNYDTIIQFILPEKENNSIKVTVNIKQHQASFEIPDFCEVAEMNNNVIPQSYFDNMDLQIIKSIHMLRQEIKKSIIPPNITVS